MENNIKRNTGKKARQNSGKRWENNMDEKFLKGNSFT